MTEGKLGFDGSKLHTTKISHMKYSKKEQNVPNWKRPLVTLAQLS